MNRRSFWLVITVILNLHTVIIHNQIINNQTFLTDRNKIQSEVTFYSLKLFRWVLAQTAA